MQRCKAVSLGVYIPFRVEVDIETYRIKTGRAGGDPIPGDPIIIAEVEVAGKVVRHEQVKGGGHLVGHELPGSPKGHPQVEHHRQVGYHPALAEKLDLGAEV